MKFLIFILSLALSFSVFAGSMTITTTTAQDQRLVVAMGAYLKLKDAQGDPRNATGAEVRIGILRIIEKAVFEEEKKAKGRAALIAANEAAGAVEEMDLN